MTNTTAKKFNKECENGLRVLSESFGFNYNKPFECFEVNGRFTNNKVLKQFEDSGYTPTDSIIFSAVKRNGCFHDFVIVRLCLGGTFRIKNELRRWMRHGDKSAEIGASELWAKYDYEDMRKDDNCHAYFFAQKREDLRSVDERKKEKAVDKEQRYKIVDFKTSTDWTTKEKYVTGVEVLDTTRSGERLTINREFLGGDSRTSDGHTIVDKSGYIVQTKRNDLRIRARKVRDERKKAEYKKTDNSGIIRIIGGKIEEARSALVKALENARTADEVQKVENALSRWRGFGDAVEDYARLKSRDSEKDFASVDSFDKAASEILETLERVKGALA